MTLLLWSPLRVACFHVVVRLRSALTLSEVEALTADCQRSTVNSLLWNIFLPGSPLTHYRLSEVTEPKKECQDS
ncbi:MAG: hypothetical protein RMY62_016155 [Nostoc sp. ZfuVER08]|nr:hypothetical protein [Nostoc sp. GBBB01]MDZ8012688.1 hypothetical protein [Nostoc sp. ZfuVER08]